MRIAIVGAGICGLYLARKLAERGENVTVFEKRDKIGKEACSGLFSERILEFIPESKELVQNQIDYALIHFPKKTLKVNFKRKFLIMSHQELDKLAAFWAEKSGAKILLKSDFNSANLAGFDRVVGCDGALSSTRKSLKLKDPRFYLGIQGTNGARPGSGPGLAPYCVETWPTKNGFVWKIPRGNELEWGIMEKPEIAKILLDRFLSGKKINLAELKSALIPQGLILSRNPRVALAGDAAGLTKPWSGGGVVWGLTACDLLLKNFPDFLEYQKGLKRFFQSKIILGRLAKRLIYFLGFNLPFLLKKNYTIDNDFLKCI